MQEIQPGRPEAAAANWSPLGAGRRESVAHRAAAARTRGMLRGLLGVAAGAVLLWLGAPIGGGVACAMGGLGLLTAVFSPLGAYARLEALVDGLAQAVAAAVSWAVLGGVWFLILAPLGWLMRRDGADPLQRKFDRTAQTYWTARRPDGSTFDRQY